MKPTSDVISPLSPNCTTQIIDDIHKITFTDSKSLKILYLNSRSINNKIEDLAYIIKTAKTDIHVISITEHWLNEADSSTFVFENYQAICSCRPNKNGGGSLILVRDNISYEIIKRYSTNENSITSIKLKMSSNENWIITSIYRPPNHSIQHINIFIDELNTHLNEINTNTLITGDMNINVKDENNINAEMYLNAMLTNNMYICDKTTITREFSQTALDHVFTNNLSKKIILSYAPYLP